MINYIELGVGLHEYLASNGVMLEQSQDGKWEANASDERVNQLIASYNPWGVEKAKKLLEINAWFQHEVEKLTAGTTQAERDSWSVQVNEACGIRPISMLSSMAAARGVSLDSLVEKVKVKAELFASKYGSLQGAKDALEDRVKSMPDSGSFDRLVDLWSIKCTD